MLIQSPIQKVVIIDSEMQLTVLIAGVGFIQGIIQVLTEHTQRPDVSAHRDILVTVQ